MSHSSLQTLSTSLTSSTDPSSKHHPPLSALRAIAASPVEVTVAGLAATQIGRVVSGFKGEEAEAKWGKETAELAKVRSS